MVVCLAREVKDFENIKLLEWWKQKQHLVPILACMAHDKLTIQACTVVSESSCSISIRIISVQRTRLSLESVQCHVCLKDYLDSIDKNKTRHH